MGSCLTELLGKSGKKYACTVAWSEGSGGLGCHAKTVYGLTASLSTPSWANSDDVRANPDHNWKTIYDALNKSMGSFTHIVMSDNFATNGPRDMMRARADAQGLREGVYANPVYRTSEIMDIIEKLAESNGDSMTLTPTSGNASHPSADGYSACITGVWLRKTTPAIVIGKTMREFWDRAKAAIGATERPRVDITSLSLDPEKRARDAEATKKKVANIWGD